MAWDNAANLTPELLARLRGYNYTNEGSYYDPQAGRWYTPQWEDAGGSGMGENYQPNYQITGWRGYDSPQSEYGADPSRLNGRAYDQYDASGAQTGTGAWSGIAGRSAMDALLPLGMVALPFAAAMFPALGSALSFGANPVLGAEAAGAAGAAGGLGAAGALPGGAGMDVAGFEGLTGADVGLTGTGGSGLAGGAGMDTAAFEGLTTGGGTTAAGTTGATTSGVSLVGSSGGMVAPAASDAAFNAAVAGSAGGNALAGILPAAGALIGPALQAAGGIYAANQAGKAADTQAKAAQDALGLQREQFNKLLELNEPFRQGGLAGQQALLTALGLADGENKGWAMRDFGRADFEADPGYQFRMDEGAKALERSAAARGGLLSGRAAKEMERFSQGTASNEFDRAYGRFQTNRANRLNPLQSLAGVGQSVSQNMGQAGMNFGNSASDLITGAGNAKAAGQVGRANAITNAVGQGVSAYQNNALMDMLLRRGS